MFLKLACFLSFIGIQSQAAVHERKLFENPPSLTGRIYTDHYFPTQSSTTYPDGIIQSSLSAWLELKENFSDSFALLAVGQMDVFYRSLSEKTKSSVTGKLREGYFNYHNDSLDIRAGQQIIPWGKSDGINPTDYFTAKEYTLLNPDDEVRRLGAPGFMMSITPNEGTSPITLTGVFQASYPQTKFVIPDQLIPVGVNFVMYPDAPRAFTTDSVEFGGKIAYQKSDFDLSASIFRGFNHFPQFLYTASLNKISPFHYKQTAFGGDASFSVGELVIRAESAYIIPDEGNQDTTYYGVLEPTHWDTVVGVEHTFLDDIHTQVQFLYRYHVNYLDPSMVTGMTPQLTQIYQTLGRTNGLLLNFQREQNFGATFRVGYSSETSAWTADLFLVGYFAQGQDYLLRPQVSYKAMEGLRLLAGGEFYGGEQSRPLGALYKNSAVFFEGRYLF